MRVEGMFDLIEEYGIASEDFVKGAICMGGYNEETAKRILFYNTGWRTFEGFLAELNGEEEEE